MVPPHWLNYTFRIRFLTLLVCFLSITLFPLLSFSLSLSLYTHNQPLCLLKHYHPSSPMTLRPSRGRREKYALHTHTAKFHSILFCHALLYSQPVDSYHCESVVRVRSRNVVVVVFFFLDKTQPFCRRAVLTQRAPSLRANMLASLLRRLSCANLATFFSLRVCLFCCNTDAHSTHTSC